MGQLLPWEGESTGRTAVLPPSKAVNPFFEGSKKEHLLVWWGTVPSLLPFERKEGVDTRPMPL